MLLPMSDIERALKALGKILQLIVKAFKVQD
jgi:hypothetical protein